jgi:CspA family cold shock protein
MIFRFPATTRIRGSCRDADPGKYWGSMLKMNNAINPADVQERELGTVKWFSQDKGYGFVLPDNANLPEVFVHFSSIEGDNKILVGRERVSFQRVKNDRGEQAIGVQRVLP